MPVLSHTETEGEEDVGTEGQTLAQCGADTQTQAKQRVKSLIQKGSGSPADGGKNDKMTHDLGCKRVCDTTVLLVIDSIPEWEHGV